MLSSSLVSTFDKTPPWIFGFRSEHTFDPYEWMPALACLLLGKFSAIQKGDKTIAAEAGFGLPPCWYWYIARPEKNYSTMVSFWQATTTVWEKSEKGVSPFDSGGIWHDKTDILPELSTNDKKKAFFQTYNFPLLTWEKTFQEYLIKNYENYNQYINGDAPKIGAKEVVKNGKNNAMAWTWEAHVDNGRIHNNIFPTTLFCTDAQRDRFLLWIEDSEDYDIPEQKWLTEWMTEHCAICDYPLKAPYDEMIEQLGNIPYWKSI